MLQDQYNLLSKISWTQFRIDTNKMYAILNYFPQANLNPGSRLSVLKFLYIMSVCLTWVFLSKWNFLFDLDGFV